jgi:hypothetical protein
MFVRSKSSHTDHATYNERRCFSTKKSIQRVEPQFYGFQVDRHVHIFPPIHPYIIASVLVSAPKRLTDKKKSQTHN